MYSLNLLNEEFRDGFPIYCLNFRSAYTVCTTRKFKQYIGKASEMTRFEKIPRVHHINKGD